MAERRPLTREEFAQLERGTRLRDRGGRIWTVVAPAYQDGGEVYVNLRFGDNAKRERQRWADDYEVVEESGGSR